MSDSAADFPEPRTWPTIWWTLASALALVVSQVLGVLAVLAWQKLHHPGQPFVLRGLATNGAAISLITFTSSVVLLLTFLGFTRIRTSAVRSYLGLRLPSLHKTLVALIALGALLIVLGFVSNRFSDPRAMNFMRGVFVTARRDHLLWLLLVAVSIAAPIGEEITFRGFLYETIALRFGPMVAIVVTALGWAALHIQYGFVSIASIFAIGLFLGATRYYARSTILTMVLHGIWNAMALIGSASLFGG